MLKFTIDHEFCTECGQCAADCPARIIDMVDGHPTISPEKALGCYQCQHCFTVCPTGALSIHGLDPAKSPAVQEQAVNPDDLEALIRSRRSIRHFLPEDVDAATIARLLSVTAEAPTACNIRPLHFCVIDNREKLAEIRSEIMEGLGRAVRENALPPQRAYFANFVSLWEEKQVDVLFRGAPHMLVVSAPPSSVAPVVDCTIALSYFEIFAQSLGVGTLWCGLVRWAIDEMLPGMKSRLGIPDDHRIGYVMLFGKPAVHYARGAQRPINISVVR